MGPDVKKIFRAFLHLGLTAYGGLGMVKPIRRQVVYGKTGFQRHKWRGSILHYTMLDPSTH
jgi:hypothetical protein